MLRMGAVCSPSLHPRERDAFSEIRRLQSRMGSVVSGLVRILPPKAECLCLPSNCFYINNSFKALSAHVSFVGSVLYPALLVSKEEKKSAWSRSFGGFRVSSRNAALRQKRQVQLIPAKLRAYEGLSQSRRVGRISGQKPRQGRLESYSTVLSALISLVCSGRRGVRRVVGGFAVKHKLQV